MSTTWVLGRGGLLGSAVNSRLESTGHRWVPKQQIQWIDRSNFRSSIDYVVDEFADEIRTDGRPWIVFWCAGIGTFGANGKGLNDELDQVGYLIQSLTVRLRTEVSRGTFFYSSSAGAIYGGSSEEFITEDSAIASNSPYGDMKLRVEELIEAWSKSSGCRAAIGRISNLYGSNQSISKRQGLITTAGLNLLQQRPLDIFVPLDTTRNYIHVADAAHIIVRFTMKVSQLPASTVERKLVCSPHNLSIASILREVRHVFGRRTPISLGRRSISSLYVRNLSLSSRRHRDVEPEHYTLPAIGIAEVRRRLLMKIMSEGVIPHLDSQ